MDKDIGNLRSLSNYKIKIVEDVYWVPVNVLGKSRYTNEEMKIMSQESPEYKRNSILYLYEAIQLFQSSEFEVVEDNKIVQNGKYQWEYHKPGYYSVLSNKGCCSACATWLKYILDGKYEEIGNIWIGSSDGTGHVINYIKDKNKYYFIDLYAMTKRFSKFVPHESGNKLDLRKNKLVTGIFIETDTVENFIRYFLTFSRMKKKEYVFIRDENDPCFAVACNYDRFQTIFYIPDNVQCVQVETPKKNSRIIIKRIPYIEEQIMWTI